MGNPAFVPCSSTYVFFAFAFHGATALPVENEPAPANVDADPVLSLIHEEAINTIEDDQVSTSSTYSTIDCTALWKNHLRIPIADTNCLLASQVAGRDLGWSFCDARSIIRYAGCDLCL